MRYVIGLALASLVSTPVLAVGRLADVTVVDRETGQHLTAHYHAGEYWVAGRPGAHYAIHIQSREGRRRLLAITSVDGVNVLTGEDAGHLQRGYVFEPWQGYDIAGWRKTGTEIAAFTFTSIPRSYAARTGRPDNIGVIGVALFAERQYPRISAAPPPPAPTRPYAEQSHELEEVEVTGARIQGGAKAESSLQHAPAAPPPANAATDAQRDERQSRAVPPSLGTGHGRREYSRIHTVQFDRASSTPDEVIRIRYDSRENLVALGVIHRPPPGPKPVDPFPQSPRTGYVPDP